MTPRSPESIGRYRVLERLGAGGMGVLYLALDPAIDRQVAIKQLRVHDRELLDRFIREARTAGRLQHLNIVTIFDVGQQDGEPFIAMEYVPGKTLAETIARREPLSLVRRLELAEQLCDGLAFAHRHDIVHRDVKPANLMIHAHSGLLKILDFGIARVADSHMTQSGAQPGTPSYMSPEQINNETLDGRSDIFSVGLVLYELLAYQKAFQGEVALVVMRQILDDEPTPLGELRPDLSQDLVRAVERAISKDPADRFADLGLLRDALTLVKEEHTGTLSGPDRPRSVSESTLRLDAARQLRTLLATADDALGAGNIDAARAAAAGARRLAPHDPQVNDVLTRLAQILEDRQVNEWLEVGERHLANGAPRNALTYVKRILEVRDPSTEGQDLQRRAERALVGSVAVTETETAGRSDRVSELTPDPPPDEDAVSRAQFHLGRGKFEAARQAAQEILWRDPKNEAALAVLEQATAAQDDAHRRAAQRTTSEAKHLFDEGDHSGALAVLKDFTPPHELIRSALDTLKRDIASAQRRQRDLETDRRRREAEEEQHRQVAAVAERAAEALDEGRLQAAAAALAELDSAGPHAIDVGPLRERLERLTQVDEILVSSRTYLDAGVLDRAVETVEKALAIVADSPAALALRQEIDRRQRLVTALDAARAHLGESAFASAAHAADEALSLAPDNADAEALRAQAVAGLEYDGYVEAAEAALATAALDEARDAIDRAARLRADAPRVAELQARVVVAWERRELREHLTAAQELLRTGVLDEAADRLDQALQLDPDSSAAHALLSDIDRRRNVTQRLVMARASLAAGEFEQAVNAATEALETDPQHGEALSLRHEAEAALELAPTPTTGPSPAEEDGSTVLAPEVAEQLAMARRSLAQGVLGEAVECIDQALQLAPDSAEVLSLLDEVELLQRVHRGVTETRALFESGAFDEVVRAADEVLAIDPGQSDALEIKTRALSTLQGGAGRGPAPIGSRDTAGDEPTGLTPWHGFEAALAATSAPPVALFGASSTPPSRWVSWISRTSGLLAVAVLVAGWWGVNQIRNRIDAVESCSERTRVRSDELFGMQTVRDRGEPGDAARARVLYLEFLERYFPDPSGCLPPEMEAQARRGAEVTTATLVSEWIEAAERAVVAGRPADAAERYGQALALDPYHASARAARDALADR